MALGNPNIDPLVEQQLYGPDPALADGSPAPHGDPWAWVPPEWDATAPVDPTADLAHIEAPPPGTAPPTAASFAPAAPAMPGIPPPGQPPGDPSLPPPVDSELAGNPALQPAAAAPPGALVDPFGEPPLPAPDALTDAGGMPATGELGGIPYEPTRSLDQLPQAHYRSTVAQYGADPLAIPDAGERQRYLNALAARDPAAFAELQARHDAEREKLAATARAKAINDAYDQQLHNMRARQEADRVTQAKSAALLADAQRIFDTKIDRTGGISGFGAIAGVLSAAVGGLVRGRTGSNVNPGMEALDSVINRGIEAQKADLAHQREGLGFRRSLLAEEYARHGDEFQASEAIRLATLKHADDLLSIEQMNYDPAGTTALKIAGMRAGIAQQQAAGLQAFQQKTFDDSLKLQNAAREQQIADETARKNREDAYLRAQELANARADRKDAQVARADEKAAERADKEAERDRQFAIGGAPHLQVGPDGAPVVGSDGNPVVSYEDLRNADGRVWRVADPQVRKDLGDKVTAAKSLVKLYDRALAIRDRVGGESGIFNSADRQELDQIEAEVKILRKQGTQGMSSDEDMQNLAQAGGAKDIASFRSRSPGIEVARARLQDQLNDALRTARYTGPAITFPKPRATTNTPEEDSFQRLLQAPNASLDEEVRRELDARQRAAGREGALDITNNPADQALYHGAYEAARSEYDPAASRDQQHQIAALGIAAAGTSPDALVASAKLQQIASTAQTTKLRELARQALQAAQSAALPGAPAAQGQDRGVSYETVPPLPPRGGR